MNLFDKKRYRIWGFGLIAFAIIFILDCVFFISGNKITILVNAPKNMHNAFVQTLDDTKLDKKYTIEFTEDDKTANFVVNEGLDASGNLIAYSPIVAVFHPDEDLYNEFISSEVFVQSSVESEEYDFDFLKIIDSVIEDPTLDFKIYYPSKNSVYWEEFYNFLLFTVNDGYYPKNYADKKIALEKVEAFLNSRCTEELELSSFERLHGMSKNTIFFMPLVNLATLNNECGPILCRVMYPKTVVYHSYYASFDETGDILYDALDSRSKGFISSINKCGYYYLTASSFHTKYGGAYNVGGSIYGTRRNFNGVEIPKNSSK